MANQEHLDILNQGVQAWNQWKQEHRDIRSDLSIARLSKADLSGANLSDTDLSRTNLSMADLSGAYLYRANLSGANLIRTDLSRANLGMAELSRTTLISTNFSGAHLYGVNLSEATMHSTIFGDVDLREVQGLDTIHHHGPLMIAINTIYRSHGQISENFLRKAGLPEVFITYARSLVNTPIDYYTCFISHSSKDQAFAERLYADLQSKGVRCWFASEDLKIGDHYHQRIDESIRLYDKLVLILSEYAVQSAWIEREVVAAREKEDREQKPVLFPVRLDDAVMDTTKAWAADVRRRWHIGDFTQWKHHDAYQKTLERLLRDLKSEA